MNRRLQMGMWNGLDPAHWEAYTTERITGLEVSQFRSLEQMEELHAFVEAKGLGYGIHTPVLGGQGYSLPAITSLEAADREAGFARLAEEAAVGRRFGADYLLLHYPYPSIFPRLQDEAYMRRLPQFEHYSMDHWRDSQFQEYTERAFERIGELQARTGQRIVLEYDFFGDYEMGWIADLFRQYRDIGLVVDLQRFDVHRRVFPGFDPYAYMDAVAPFVYLVHYSNVKYGPEAMDRHLPVLPEHAELPDYGDAPRYLEYLSRRNDRFHLTFEHNPARVTKEQLAECYEHAAEIMNGKARAGNA